MNCRVRICVFCCVALAHAAPAADPAVPPFTPLGTLDAGANTSQARAVSPDGSVVFGTSARAGGRDGFRWTRATGITPLDLGDLGVNGHAADASADGTVVAGTRFREIGPLVDQTAFVATVGNPLTPLPPLLGFTNLNTWANSVSGDGSVVVGMQSGTDTNGQGLIQAVRWTNGVPAPLVGVGSNPRRDSTAYGVSRDGTVVVGGIWAGASHEVGFRWTAGTGAVELALPPGFTSSAAVGISADNSTIIGAAIRDADGDRAAEEYQAVRHRADGTIDLLGDLPGGPVFSVAHAVSADGSVVVGRSAVGGAIPRGDDRAFVWDAAHGMRDLKTLLTALGADLDGWTRTAARDVSDDGLTIVGSATNPAGREEAFIAVIPEPVVALPLLAAAALCRRRARR